MDGDAKSISNHLRNPFDSPTYIPTNVVVSIMVSFRGARSGFRNLPQYGWFVGFTPRFPCFWKQQVQTSARENRGRRGKEGQKYG